MRRAARLFAIGWIGAVVGLACSNIQVNADYDGGVDFAALRSFAWLAERQPPTGDVRLDNDLLDRRIRTAIERELTQAGHARAEAGAADFYVAYHVALDRQIDVQTLYSSYGRAGWGGRGRAETVVSDYEEGTLLVDLLLPDGSLAWRGSGLTRLSESKTPEARSKRVDEVVGKILAQYPPGS